MNYYNEFDQKAAAWLRELIKQGHIAQGEVDERSIEDVKPRDLDGYRQCHFFAGIGGWSLALRLAGWPDDQPVWTGSCPCQPFSAAGKGAGFADERHLWPAWQHLIAQCRPPVVFGEQVAAKGAYPWIDLVHADVEGMDYAFAGVAFPAAGVGSPHKRDRFYWVADANGRHASTQREQRGRQHGQFTAHGGVSEVAQGDSNSAGLAQRVGVDPVQRETLAALQGQAAISAGNVSYWSDCDWIECSDGKRRPVEPSTFPLAAGLPARVGRLRGYGNSVVAQAAQAFIEAYREAIA